MAGRFNMRTYMNNPVAESHMIIFYPQAPLEPNTTYKVALAPQIKDENGLPLTPDQGFNWEFSTY